ncbi:MAG: hypothetical protein V1774_08755, partial [Candidatus Eisenbacteria bacterium]
MSLRHQMGSWLVWLLPAMLLLFPTGGCDEDQASKPGGQENDGPVIAQVEADPVYLIPGEAAAIAVRVVRASDPQSPVAGVSVDFAEVGRQTQGLFVPSSANTDEQGWAHTSYQPPQGEVGQLDVKAMTGSDVGYLSLFISTDGPAQSGLAVVIDAEETSLPADGTSTLQLTVSVTEGGVGLSGKSVVLTAGELFEDVDGDGLFGAGDELLADADDDGEWDAVGAVTSPVTTDGSGMASATYTAGVVVGELYIKATVDSAAT